MRRFVFCLAIVSSLTGMSVAEAQMPPTTLPAPSLQTMYAIKLVNIRADAGTEYNVIGKLPQGQAILVTGKAPTNDQWYQLSTGGYVAASFLSPSPVVVVRKHRTASMAQPASPPPVQYRVGDCQPYVRVVNIAGDAPQTIRGTACLEPDGSWKIMKESASSVPQPAPMQPSVPPSGPYQPNNAQGLPWQH